MYQAWKIAQKVEIKLVPLTSWQRKALESPYTFTCMFGGIAALKTATAAHFVIKQLFERPHLTGLIGANTYDQLSQVMLRELFKWLDEYKIEYVIDKMPPREWNHARQFKSYQNILLIRHPITGQVATWFTRVLSDPDALRGLTISFFVLDEVRDTKRYAWDVLLSRLRESEYMHGLIVTTTCGMDWVYDLFVKNADYKMYGAMHVETYESVKVGIITQQFYNSLLASYSEMMAAQELFALHVNVLGGRAYYAAGEHNKKFTAPWGDTQPNRERPLVVGMDFNYAPAPCVWMVGQEGPPEYGPHGEVWSNHIHWFSEISHVEASSQSMTIALMAQFPDFFYRIYGDASGNRGTTSNAGQTDYDQIGIVLADANAQYSIDSDQANPHVKDRVENMNANLKNAMGEVHMTYNPQGCPQFDADMRMVGWKQTIHMGRGKLDNGGDIQRTHASDGAGYALWKLKPPSRRGNIGQSVQSYTMRNLGHVLGAQPE